MDTLIASEVSFGLKVRAARVLCGWRQVDLAAIAEVTQANVSSLERDFPVYPAARQRILAALSLADVPPTVHQP